MTDRRPKREASRAIQVDDESDFEEEDRMIEYIFATGVARPSKSRGFGRPRVYQDPWNDVGL